MYFITLVSQNRECNLGNIENGAMILSDLGEIVESEWVKSFEIRNELFLDEYITMPNHLHAIVILEKQNTKLQTTITQQTNPNFFRKPQSISSFVGGFKSAINTKIDDYIDEYNLMIPKYNRNNHFFSIQLPRPYNSKQRGISTH